MKLIGNENEIQNPLFASQIHMITEHTSEIHIRHTYSKSIQNALHQLNLNTSGLHKLYMQSTYVSRFTALLTMGNSQ